MNEPLFQEGNRSMSRLMQRIVFALLIAAAPVLAQTGLGSITGSVQDSTGGIIAGAKVRLTENATQVARTTTTNEAGIFTFPSVVVGTYSVAVAHPGSKRRRSRIWRSMRSSNCRWGRSRWK